MAKFFKLISLMFQARKYQCRQI